MRVETTGIVGQHDGRRLAGDAWPAIRRRRGPPVWSEAMIIPPASGTPPPRSCRSRVSAAVMTAGIHSPAGSSAVRQARAVCSAVSGSPSRARSAPRRRCRATGPHRSTPGTPPGAPRRRRARRCSRRCGRPSTAAGRRRRARSVTNGIGASSLRNGVPVNANRRVASPNASRIASPQLLASPPWWISSKITSVRLLSVRTRCRVGWLATWA